MGIPCGARAFEGVFRSARILRGIGIVQANFDLSDYETSLPKRAESLVVLWPSSSKDMVLPSSCAARLQRVPDTCCLGGRLDRCIHLVTIVMDTAA